MDVDANSKSQSQKSRRRHRRQSIKPDQKADLDEKTKKVFDRKGYEVLTILGAGSFGKIYKAIRRSSNELCAVKVIDLLLCSNKYKKKFLPRELAVLMEAKHKNIIHIYDIFRSNKKIFIFMEFATNGDLGRYIRKRKAALTEDLARFWFRQTTAALIYLHEEMFTAHRDIKIENILLSPDWQAKLTDFGFATEAVDENGNVIYSETFCGTLPYYCPNILQKLPYNPFKADSWALGVTLYAMTHNRFPFHYRDYRKMMEEQLDQTYLETRFTNNTSESLRDLTRSLLDRDEDKRMSVSSVMKHQWVLEDNLEVIDVEGHPYHLRGGKESSASQSESKKARASMNQLVPATNNLRQLTPDTLLKSQKKCYPPIDIAKLTKTSKSKRKAEEPIESIKISLLVKEDLGLDNSEKKEIFKKELFITPRRSSQTEEEYIEALIEQLYKYNIM